jgi:hypothetical protein
MIKLSRTMQGGHVAHVGGMRNAYRILVRKPEWKKTLGRYTCRHEDKWAGFT